MTIKTVELFAGVGGFRIGLENASKDFITVWANQWEPGKKSQHAFDCYAYHFQSKGGVNEFSNVDINEAKQYCPDCDLLCGGFPCQDYSVAATGAKGIEGKKGVLWWDIRDIVENKRPNYLLLENVDRLVKSPVKQRGRDFGIILKSLNDLGYAVEWRIINAAEYGCAQRRRRIFIFAYHQSTQFYQKVKEINKKTLILKQGFFADIFSCNKNEANKSEEFNLGFYKDLADISNRFAFKFENAGICIENQGMTLSVVPNLIKAIPLERIVQNDVSESYFLNDIELEKFKYLRGSKKILRYRPNGEKYFYSEGAMSEYDELDKPARTMLTSESSINRSTHIIKDKNNGRLRKLTQIECERINGFPDDWTNTGMPPKFRYFCMGNALVVPLITKIGKKIVKISN